MCVRLHKPQRVVPHCVLIASDFLLLKPPVGQLDFVREEIAACERMPQLEFRTESSETLGTFAIALIAFFDLNYPVVVGIAHKTGESVRGDLVLELNLRDGWAHVVRVESLFRDHMVQPHSHARLDGHKRYLGEVKIDATISALAAGGIHDEPVIVCIAMWVQGDLLL